MAISQEKLDKINQSLQEHLRKEKEDPEYRAKCEEDKRRLDEYYAFGTKPKK